MERPRRAAWTLLAALATFLFPRTSFAANLDLKPAEAALAPVPVLDNVLPPAAASEPFDPAQAPAEAPLTLPQTGAAAFTAAAAQPEDPPPQDLARDLFDGERSALFEKLALTDTILKNGGIEAGADGKIFPSKPIKISAFDIDENVVFLPTNNYLRHKRTGEIVTIHSSEYARAKKMAGKEGRYKELEFYEDSFRDTRDNNDPHVFRKHIEQAVAGNVNHTWRGPSWFRFATALADDNTAHWVTNITSRGHLPHNMAAGFQYLVEKGFLKRAPRTELMFGVNGDHMTRHLPPNSGTPEKKAEVLIALLDLIERVPLAKAGEYHSLGFSDDDAEIIGGVKARLYHEQVERRRWPHVKISLFSTGPGIEHAEIYVAGAKVQE